MSEPSGWHKKYKIAAGIVGAIFLGAIGNGFWEWFLRDALTKSFSYLASGLGSVSSSYLDHLHAQIGKANNSDLLLAPMVMLVSFVVLVSFLGPFLLLRMRRKLRREDPHAIEGQDRVMGIARILQGRKIWLFVAMSLFNVVSYSETLFASAYNLKAITWIERSIEIVRPKITEADYYILRAEFRSVSDAASFYQVYEHLRSYEKGTASKLPEFDPVGR